MSTWQPPRRVRVGVDLDGVLYDWAGTTRFLLNHYLGYALPPLEDWCTSWDALKNAVQPEDWAWVWSEGIEKGLFRHGHVYTGSMMALEVLSAFADIVVITHRPLAAGGDTLRWLAHHQVPLTELHLLVRQEPKSGVVCDVYVDDGAHNVRDLAAAHPAARVLLWRRPWNAHEAVPSTVYVVSDWAEVILHCRLVSSRVPQRTGTPAGPGTP